MRESVRRRSVGVVVGLLATTVAWAGQAPSSRASAGTLRTSRQSTRPGGVVYDVHPTPEGGSLLTAAAPGLRVEKTLFADRVVVVLRSDSEQVILRVEGPDTLSVDRKGRTKSLSAATLTRGNLEQMRALLSGSEAVGAFRALVGVVEDDEPSAEGESILITGATVAMLDGDVAAPRRLVRKLLSKDRSQAPHGRTPEGRQLLGRVSRRRAATGG